jgi:hypothetical protein
MSKSNKTETIRDEIRNLIKDDNVKQMIKDNRRSLNYFKGLAVGEGSLSELRKAETFLKTGKNYGVQRQETKAKHHKVRETKRQQLVDFETELGANNNLSKNDEKRSTALKHFEYSIHSGVRKSPKLAVHSVADQIKGDLLEHFNVSGKFKVIMKAKARYQPKPSHDQKKSDEKTFYIYMSNPEKMQSTRDINEYIKSVEKSADINLEIGMQKLAGSGHVFGGITKFILSIFNVKSLRVGSWIKSPDYLGRGVVNIVNEDDECFKWCLKYHQSDKSKNSARLSALKKVNDKYNYDDLTFPLQLDDIEVFESNNASTGVNVFEVIDNRLTTIYKSSNVYASDRIVLMMIREDDKLHYCYVKNIDQMLTGNEMNQGKKGHKWCEDCQNLIRNDNFENHKCQKFDGTEITFKKQTIQFEKYQKTIMAPFVCYYDFESFLIDTKDTRKVERHQVNSYCYQIICSFDQSLNVFRYYCGPDAVGHFLETLLKDKDRINRKLEKLKKKYPYPVLSYDEETVFKSKKSCYKCYKKSDKLFRDHCHFTGKYRGAACNSCNSAMQQKKEEKIICIAHNANYDGQFILSEAHKFVKNIKCISTSSEKFMCFDFCNLKFIDSFKFLGASLSKLVENITKDANNHVTYDALHFSKAYFGDNIKYMSRKGIYPYSYPKNFDVFNLGLPAKVEFFDKLSNKHVEQSEYDFANEVYEVMNCQNFGDYHALYLKSDVLLLTDVFEGFRKLALEYYELDPCHYVSLPSMSQDAMLKVMMKENEKKHKEKKEQLKTLSEEEKLTFKKHKNTYMTTLSCEDELRFFEKQKRGGICQVGAKKNSVAYNKYMNIENFDKNKKQTFISYIDANNLYGYAMSLKLPYEITGNRKDVTVDEVLNLDPNGEVGMTCEIDFEYPKELHDHFKDYVPGCVSRAVQFHELSNYQKYILDLNKSKHNETNKLILDLNDKQNYICDFRYAQCLIRCGVKITKVHQVYDYKMDFILKPYIDFNSDKRKQAKNDFEKDFFKLLNNSIYGKMLQDVLKQNDTVITSDRGAPTRLSRDRPR